MPVASVDDYRELARRRLPHFLFEYIDGGSYAEQTLARNVGDLAAVALRQRVLRDVSLIDLRTEFLGASRALPFTLAPVGLAGFCARRGEVGAARAAAARGAGLCLSTVSLCSMEEVAAATGQPFWFQLYVMRDRDIMRDLVARAAALRCSALVLTVDLPVAGARYRDARSGLAMPPGVAASLRRGLQIAARPGWMLDVGLRGGPHTLGNIARYFGASATLDQFFAWLGAQFDASVTWEDLADLRARWPGPLIVKGILDADDARRAADAGVDAIVVSNHGGRQLDGVPSTARALPAIAAAVGARVAILADSGVRSGLDVLRLLALGARHVLIGRAWAYALAAGGEPAVGRLIDLLSEELRVALALTGCPNLGQVTGDLLVAPDAF